ncbi:MAG TPA: CHAT domain-containing tetratricopeptide repeat protein [Thermoanaerobaculia bacterium]|nr:CHAT domain-containing tetratricopeptide repeat protein [Thermoanaerobaculia bacterium]
MHRRWRRIALPLGAVALSLAFPDRAAVVSSDPFLSDHAFAFELKAGWLLRLSFEQRGTDILVRVLGPEGRELFRVDSPTGGEGSEEVWLVADRAGFYRILVETWGGGEEKGRYRARIVARRLATPDDRRNAVAERAFSKAFGMEGKAPHPWLEQMYLGAAHVWGSLGRRGREADAWHRLGRVRSAAGGWRAALKAQRRARSLYRAVGALRPEAKALEQIAEAHEALGEMKEARHARLATVPLWKALGDTESVIATDYRICQLSDLLGRAWEALECYDRVLAGWKGLGNRAEQGKVWVEIGTLHTSLGDLDGALAAFRKALALLPEANADRGAALTQIGNACLRAGVPRLALDRFKKALAISRAVRNPRGEASALNGIGLAWQRIGRPARALAPLRRALALLDRLGNASAGQATVWCNLGRLHLSLDQPQPAEQAFERGLELATRAGNRGAQAAALSGMARVARRRGDWAAARELAERTLDVVESLRADAAPPSPVEEKELVQDLLKATYLASKQDHYEFLIDLLMERHRLEPERGYDLQALELNERSLARSLSDRLGARSALPLEEIRRSALDPGTALLAYSLGEDRSHLWWITRTAHASYELPGRAVLEGAARRLHGLMARSHRRDRAAAARRRAAEVSRLLLGPVADRLDGGRLVIVAPDALQYVPFGVLPHPSVPEEPLLARHEVIRTPSATVLSRLRTRRSVRERARGLAAVGDAVFNGLDSRLPFASERTPGRGAVWRRLPYVDDEIRSILGMAQGQEVLAATGFDAIPDLVIRGALRSYSILHFATHGLTDPKRPGRSALLLSLYDRRGRPRKAWLRAEEIQKLDLTADLVVLSACSTALGREVRGEGLIGLSRSFLAAGASSALVSLWNVDDQATAELMERFYRGLLKQGHSPAEALRDAQLSLRKEPRWSAPYYWGGFVLQGDGLNKTRIGGSP